MSLMWVRIYNSLTHLICNSLDQHQRECHCETLRRHYGTRIFKCWYPSCSLSRRGFTTSKDCETHVKCDNHSRAWKCSVQGCPYTVIGFSTFRDAHSHWETRHRIPKSSPVHTIQAELSAEVQVLLFELTKSGDVEGIQRLVPVIAAHDWDVGPAIMLAAARGSLPIVEVLTDWSSSWPEDADFYKAIMRGENPDMLLWFLEKTCCTRLTSTNQCQWLAGEAVATTSPDMYAVWESFFLDPDRGLNFAYPYYAGDPNWKVSNNGTLEWPRSVRERCLSSVLFSSSTFVAAKKNILFEVRLVHTWHKLINDVLGGKALNRTFLGRALLCLVRLSNPSITLATELLRLGAPIDFPRGIASNAVFGSSSKSSLEQQHEEKFLILQREEFIGRRINSHKRQKGLTILHSAARRTSQQAAELVRLLLEQGAEPEYGWRGTKPATEPGVAVLQKWIGETWEELVERTKGARLDKGRRLAELYGEVYVDVDDDDEEDEEEEEDREGEEEQEKGKRKGKGKQKEDSEDEAGGESLGEHGRKRRKTET